MKRRLAIPSRMPPPPPQSVPGNKPHFCSDFIFAVSVSGGLEESLFGVFVTAVRATQARH